MILSFWVFRKFFDSVIPDIIYIRGSGFWGGNGPAWDAAVVNLPYYIYKFDGDKSVVLDNVLTILRNFYYLSQNLTREGILFMGKSN